jgi:hypothetical protein
MFIQESDMVEEKTENRKSSKKTKPKITNTNKKNRYVDRELTLLAKITPKERKKMIAETAYFKALDREYQGDDCLKDWLDAESEIDTLIDDALLESYEEFREMNDENDDSKYCG